MTTILTALAKTAIAAAALALTAGSASAWGFDICEDVTMTFRNNTGAPVQIFDIDYYDYGQSIWRSEPTTNMVIPAGGSQSVTRNLEDVENADTLIRVYFRELGSDGRWSGNWYYEGNRFTCRENARVTVNMG